MNIPNMLSAFRILLIPVFVVVFFLDIEMAYYYIPAVILIVSGLTDMLDGYIARKYHMTTYLGKILDPLADKLTQVAVCICLAMRYDSFLYLFIVFAIKEICSAGAGIIITKRQIKLISAKWFGKLSTIIFYLVMCSVLMFPHMPEILRNILVLISATITLFAFFMYIPVYIDILKNQGD